MRSRDWTPSDAADAADDQAAREWWKAAPDPDAWQDPEPDEDALFMEKINGTL